MKIATEPIGSIPRPAELLKAVSSQADAEKIEMLQKKAVEETLRSFTETGSPVVTDGEQSKSSFLTYPLEGLKNLSSEGLQINFADGHSRQLPLLTRGPFRYSGYAVKYLEYAKSQSERPVKQAVISASALSLIYPQEGIDGYSHKEFLNDLVDECEKDIRLCLEKGAYKVQMDFTEGRLSLKLDPSGGVLKQFINLNNRVLERFTDEERTRLGVHVCPGGDHDSTHSADVDYTSFLPYLFELKAGSFYLQLASEKDRVKVLRTIRKYAKPSQKIFVGVIDVINPVVETPEKVRDRVLEAAEFIPPEQLGTTDDCGFSPFCDDVSTTRETAFLKIKARIEGTRLAEEALFQEAGSQQDIGLQGAGVV